MDRREAALVGIGGVNLPVVLHRGRQGQRLAAGPGAEIDHLFARLRSRQQRGELRAFVLDFDQSLDKGMLGMDRRTFGAGIELDPQPDRRPARRLCLEIGQRRRGVIAAGLQRVDAQIDRRARRQRGPLLRALLAEDARKMRIEPFRIIARNVRRRAGQRGVFQRGTLGLRQRLRRKARSVEQFCDRFAIKPAFELEHAEQHSPRRGFAHDIGAGGAAAQRVVDEARNARAVAGSGKTVRQAPILQRVAGGPAARFDIGKNFDGGGKPGGRRHGRPSMIRRMNTTHMMVSTTAPANEQRPANRQDRCW